MVLHADGPQSSRAFVGRERELTQLVAAYESASAGTGSVVLLAGEAGIGKTALCEQLAIRVLGSSGRVLVGHCYEQSSLSLPYLPFIEALHNYVLSSATDLLKDQLGIGAPFVARVLPEVREYLQVQPSPLVEPNEDRWRLHQSLADFVRNIAGDPLLLILEDLHWADRDTLDLLEHLVRNVALANNDAQVPRLLIVATYRDYDLNRESLSPSLAELRRSGAVVDYISLGGLSIQEVRKLHEILHGGEAPSERIEMVHQQTEGNPLFVQEMLRYLEDEPAAAHASTDVPARLPAGLRDVVSARLGGLSEACNESLSLGAVIGREFRLDVLQRASGLSQAEIVESLTEAKQAAILEETPRPGGVLYRFRHAVFQQVLYEQLGAGRRLEIHPKVGRALAEVYAGRQDERASELFEHFSNSTDMADLSRAVRYGATAAQAAMNVFAYEQAARLLELTLEVQGLVGADHVTRFDLTEQLGKALIAAGKATRVVDDVAPEALRIATELDDERRAFAACCLALEAGPLRKRANTPEWIDRAERYAGDDPQARIRLNYPKSAKLLHSGNFKEARELLSGTIDLAHRQGIRDQEVKHASFLLRLGIGSDQEERKLFDDLKTRPREDVGIAEEAMSHFDAVSTHLQWGEREYAAAEQLELSRLASTTRYDAAIKFSQGGEALFAILDGRLKEALELSRDAQIGTFPYSWQASILSWLGDTTALEGLLRSHFAVGGFLLYGPAFKGLVLSQLGRYEEARRSIVGPLARLAETPLEDPVAFSLPMMLLEPCVLTGDKDGTELLLQRLRGDSRLLVKPDFILLPRRLGLAAVLLAHFPEARRHYQAAIEFCSRVGHRPELALTRLDLAELLLAHYPDDHSQAVEHLDSAIAELKTMGMAPALQKALALHESARAATGRSASYPDGLSAREVEVLRLITLGRSNREIAEELTLSVRTIERHIANLYAKAGLRTKAQAATYAHRKNLV
jgi:DNA-binding CsgD family transcriptional regulator